MNGAPATRDYFAEMYVAGMLADAGWQIYFPRRDVGFDFIAVKSHPEGPVLRPVQVKGRYPTETKTDKKYYGFDAELTQLHPEMVLAIAFFTSARAKAPECIAFMPRCQLRPRKTPNRFYSFPAAFRKGRPIMRRDFRKFFDDEGIRLLGLEDFPFQQPGVASDAEPVVARGVPSTGANSLGTSTGS